MKHSSMVFFLHKLDEIDGPKEEIFATGMERKESENPIPEIRSYY